MLGTFFPWKARTLDDSPLKFTAFSPGTGRWRFSCWRSFVVVIFVRSPATISMTSPIGIPLISYFSAGSSAVLRRLECRLYGLYSSFAKLWICAKSRTLIVFPSWVWTSSNDLAERGIGGAAMEPSTLTFESVFASSGLSLYGASVGSKTCCLV